MPPISPLFLPLLPKPPRTYCNACVRPHRACICGCVRPCGSAVELLILQHPLEERHAKSTARLLHLCVQNGGNEAGAGDGVDNSAASRLQVGEQFEPAALAQWLHAGGKQAALLYPESVEANAENSAEGSPVMSSTTPIQAQNMRLVVLDATWQNSRRLLRLNPAIQALPRIALQKPAPTRYRAIRVAHAPHQLSTIEAAAAALAQLDPQFSPQPLMAAFDAFLAVQLAFLPAVRKHHRA